MNNCCEATVTSSNPLQCPFCQHKGKSVPLITLKSLLKPASLETIDPQSSYAFCTTATCEVVYFNASQSFTKDTLKVPVFQKELGMDVPVCYCFGWTRERLIQAVKDHIAPSDLISKHVQANRCGCEVNNPQGSCCLGNVTAFIRSLDKNF